MDSAVATGERARACARSLHLLRARLLGVCEWRVEGRCARQLAAPAEGICIVARRRSIRARVARADQDDAERERRGPRRGCVSHWTSLLLCDLNPMLAGRTITPR